MKKSNKMNADVVIVGSGPGGASVARGLTLKGKKVILVERGGDNKPKGTVLNSARFLGGLKPQGKGILKTSDGLLILRCLTLGGSSMMYLGSAWDPDASMFQKYGLDLSKELQEIKEELKVQVLPDELIGPGASLIMKSALGLGHQWEKIPKLMNIDNCKVGCNECALGCRYGAKFHARDWVVDAMDKGLTVLTDTYCDEVIVENKTATGIRALGPSGKLEINAKAVVISAGGLGSPPILQKSGIPEAGQTFFFDPFVQIIANIEKKLNPSRELMMVTGMHLKEEGIMLTDMVPPQAMLFNLILQGVKLSSLLSFVKPNKGKLGIMVKIRDEMSGLIDIKERMHLKTLTADEQYKLNKGKTIARKILQSAGAKEIYYSMVGAAHPGGSCPIGKVVDKNLETEFKNLYVCDASVIPQAWGVPPSLTLLTLGRVLSKHLAEKV